MVEVDPAKLRAESERVLISPASTSDIESYQVAMERSARRIGVWNPVNPRDLVHHLSAQSDQHRTFLVRARESVDGTSLVGVVNVSNVIRGRFMSATMGYNAFDPYAGTGLFREGLGLVVDIALREPPTGLGLHRVEANVRIGNSTSAGVLRSLGFRRERTMRRMLWLADGLGGPSAWHDHDSYAVTREEWPAPQYAAQDGVGGVLVLGAVGDNVPFVVAVARELGATALFDLPFDAALAVARCAGAPVLWCAGERADDAVAALRATGVGANRVDREVAAQLAPGSPATPPRESVTQPGVARSVVAAALAVRPYLT